MKGPAYHELPVDGQAGSRITNPVPIEPDRAQKVPLARVAILVEMDCKSVIRRLHNDMVDQFLLTFVDRRTLLAYLLQKGGDGNSREVAPPGKTAVYRFSCRARQSSWRFLGHRRNPHIAPPFDNLTNGRRSV